MTTENKYKSCVDCKAQFYDLRGEIRCTTCQTVATDVATAKGLADIARLKCEAAEKTVETVRLHNIHIPLALKKNFRIYSLIWLAVWTAFGGCWALYIRFYEGHSGCVYRSIASLMNPGFVVGCEIFRERFEIGKDAVK